MLSVARAMDSCERNFDSQEYFIWSFSILQKLTTCYVRPHIDILNSVVDYKQILGVDSLLRFNKYGKILVI